MVPADKIATPHVPPIVLHPLVTRITHWLNALAIFVMIGSGWRIYNSEPLFGFEFPVWMTFGGWPEVAALAQRGGSGRGIAVALRGDVAAVRQFARLSRLRIDVGAFSP
jgi:hypothetical protein